MSKFILNLAANMVKIPPPPPAKKLVNSNKIEKLYYYTSGP